MRRARQRGSVARKTATHPDCLQPSLAFAEDLVCVDILGNQKVAMRQIPIWSRGRSRLLKEGGSEIGIEPRLSGIQGGIGRRNHTWGDMRRRLRKWWL